MGDLAVLKGKRVLVVDDEPDVLETVADLLDMCLVETALDFVSAEKYLQRNPYDAVILDIMGVSGYRLLEIARSREIPAVMLTAQAMNPENLVRSIQAGAQQYLPKDKMADLAEHLADMFHAMQGGDKARGRWFLRLRPYFDQTFGPGWRDAHPDFWRDFDAAFIPSQAELSKML